MRIDFEIAILLAVGGFLLGASLMAAPLLYDIPRRHLAFYFWGGLGLGIASVLLAAYLAITEELSDMPRQTALFGMGISGLAFLGFTAWYFWPRATDTRQPHPLDNAMSVTCEMSNRPDNYRADKKTYIVQILDPFLPDGSENKYFAGNTFFPPGDGRFNWVGTPAQAYGRCKILNYGAKAAFGAHLQMKVSWLETVKTDGGLKSGAEIAVRQFASPKFDLPASPNGEDYFYIVNNSKYFMIIEAPDAIMARVANGQSERQAVLIKPSLELPFNGVFLNPADWSKIVPAQAAALPRPAPGSL